MGFRTLEPRTPAHATIQQAEPATGSRNAFEACRHRGRSLWGWASDASGAQKRILEAEPLTVLVGERSAVARASGC